MKLYEVPELSERCTTVMDMLGRFAPLLIFLIAPAFQPRPSAGDYNGTSSGASNLGPSNPQLINQVSERMVAYRHFNDLPANASVPVDAVTASASGLDPDISVQNALDQAPRVARARRLPVARVISLVHVHTTPAQWGFLSEPVVNVLKLNLALEALR